MIAWPMRRLLLALTPLLLACPTGPGLDDDDSAASSADDDDLDDDDAGDDDDVTTSWTEPFSLLSLNLHCLSQEGTPYDTLDERLEAIATLVVDEDVAVLALQEACVQGEVDAAALLRDKLGAPWTLAWSFAHVGWEGTPEEADEGLAVLARGELSEPATLEYFAQGPLRRVAQLATLPAELGELRLASVHLDYDAGGARELQARESGARLMSAAADMNLLIAGDFNATPGSPATSAVEALGFVDLTPALDAGRIDHVFAHRAAGLTATSARLAFTGELEPAVSDHPGVLVRLSPAEPTEVLQTRLVAHTDAGFGHHLAIRGDTSPLDWDRGWPMEATADDRWELLLTELPDGPFTWKVLLDDETWQTGEDNAGQAGQVNETTPTF